MDLNRRTLIQAGLSLAAFAVAGGTRAFAAEGGVLNIGTNREMNYNMMSFSLTGDSLDYVYSWPIYESLFRPNAEGTVDPWLLESVDADPEAMTYTFHIRPGVTFSDGTALNASVVKWNIDHYMEVGARRNALLGALQSVEIVDDMTVKLQLSTWSSIIPTAFSREPGYMFSQLQYETHGDEFCQENPVGTGPFVLESWERNVNKVFKRNETYWGGPVSLEGVTYTIYNDPLVGQAAMMSGEIDAFAGMAYTGFKPLEDRGYEIAIPPLKSHCSLLVFNSLNVGGNDPTGNLLVRKAISHAINREEVVAAAYLGLAVPSTQFGIGTYFRNDDIVGYDFDPEKAKALLTEAGFPNGFTTKLMTEAGAANATVLQIIQAHLANVGITADIEIPTGAAGNQAASGWGYGMWYQTSSVYVNVAMQMASMFRQNLTGNILGLATMQRPDEVHELLSTAVAAKSDDEAVAAVKEANKLLIDEYAIYLPIAEYAYSYIISDRIAESGIGASFYSVATLEKAHLA